jgi:4-hydroxybenzoate polyprenyltransferase
MSSASTTSLPPGPQPIIAPSPTWQRLLPYAQLLRLPNVFTAFADICLGAFVTGALPEQWASFTCLLLASGCLYCAGMVWNDFFDLEQDKRERSFRPLPSQRISLGRAALLGLVLMLAGVGFATLADLVRVPFGSSDLPGRSLWLAGILVAAIFLYDGWLKRTWAGPVGMGACRFLNVLLGLSVAEFATGGWGILLALTVGVYIVGVTWFARTEARTSNQSMLVGAAGLMLAGLALGLGVPALAHDADVGSFSPSPFFPYLLVAFGFFVGIPVVSAINRPLPAKVQGAVKRAVLGLVLLDAILATSLAGIVGLSLVVLLAPSYYLGRWIYST